LHFLGLHKYEARKYGFGLIGLSVLMIFLLPLFSIFGGFGVLGYVLTLGTLASTGFLMLIVSAFLQVSHGDGPAFTEDLMSRESVRYGPVYTQGNWISAMDEKEEKEKQGN
jgi:hypothetical protein